MSTKQAQNYTLMHLFWCPEWGSNPHLEDFKSSSSAIGIQGRRANPRLIERNFRHRAVEAEMTCTHFVFNKKDEFSA